MARAKWDVDGTRKFHAGVSHGMVYPKADGEGTANGAAWNGLTGVTESPSGAEPTDLWADNMKYARLISGEDYSFTVEAYMYPEEFEACDGLAAPVKGIRIGQQKRKAFGFSWQTKVGTDDDADKGYIIHVVWNATAQPSEKSHETMNDSPDAETFSWECDTTPTQMTGYKPTAHMTINSTLIEAAKLKLLEDKIYGTENSESTLPTPDEVIKLLGGVTETASSNMGA